MTRKPNPFLLEHKPTVRSMSANASDFVLLDAVLRQIPYKLAFDGSRTKLSQGASVFSPMHLALDP